MARNDNVAPMRINIINVERLRLRMMAVVLAAGAVLVGRMGAAGSVESTAVRHREDSAAGKPMMERRNHWAFRSVVRPAVPIVAHCSWVRNPIDNFILARLEQAHLQPSVEADKQTLIRRLYYNLLGLPPPPEEVNEFLGDRSPMAYERLVERLLASVRYGERWARRWLDVVRFAESNGFETNTERPNAWPYRDYVIRALNEDKPYDQFVLEQLAGDALGADEATGFLVGGAYDAVKSPDINLTLQQRMDELHDMVSTTSAAFLGLTVGCARCHDHKFDPVTQTDYYSMQAVFAGVQHGERKVQSRDDGERIQQAAAERAELARLEARLCMFEPLARVSKGGTDSVGRNVQALLEAKKRHEQKLKELTASAMVYAGRFEQPGPTYRLQRGEPLQKREGVTPASIRGIGASCNLPADAPEQQRRLALARWIVDARNPLTARVMVNRIWQGHFGQGIVRTPSDFGHMGAAPTHPELLDWLATEFIGSGWSVKHIQRLIVLSSAFRQSSQANAAGLAADAGDRWLWRFPPQRLEAEPIRDSILAVSGNLNLRMGGPGFDLFEPNNNYVKVYNPKQTFGPAEWRRMIYQAKPRMRLDDIFGAFDCPDAGQPAPRRTVSTTPLQALNLLNSQFMLEESKRFAQRLEREAGPDAAAEVQRAFALAFQRSARPEEQAAAIQLIRSYGLEDFCRALFNANEFFYVF